MSDIELLTHPKEAFIIGTEIAVIHKALVKHDTLRNILSEYLLITSHRLNKLRMENPDFIKQPY
jgi:hypothetical protein